MVDRKQQRLAALQRQIGRVERRTVRLEARSNRYSWLRVAIFFVGIALSVLAYFLVHWWLGAILAGVAISVFVAVARIQGHIDRSIRRHKLWLVIQQANIARMQLHWDALPPEDEERPRRDHPFEIDLDITGPHSLHRLLNVAVSRDGSARLRDWLLTTTPDLETIRSRQQLVQELIPLTRFRNKLTMYGLLTSLRSNGRVEGQHLLRWLDQMQPRGSLLPLLLAEVFLSLVTLILLALNVFGILSTYWIFALAASGLLFFSTAEQRGDLFDDAYYLRDAFSTLSVVFSFLETYPYAQHTRLKALCKPFLGQGTREGYPSHLLRQLSQIATAATLRKNTLLWALINVVVPWDTYHAFRLRQYKIRIAQQLPTWLDRWFELEALNSLATFAYLNPEYILPDIRPLEEVVVPSSTRAHQLLVSSGNGSVPLPHLEASRGDHIDASPVLLRAATLGHPLLPDEQKVTNDFSLLHLGETVIITGSNMSGKSTFLRTLGVNLCLTYAGGPANAQVFQTTPLRLFTCIRVSDSVTDGYSYFYAEVRRLKALLDAVEQTAPPPVFFLIDEIFRGTNNRERLIGSRAYVRALSQKRCAGVISTHDLELVKLADELPHVENEHFREEVVDGRMVFDYRLRPGPSPTTNALKIMQMEGLPVE